MIIQDPQTGRAASVNEENQLEVSAVLSAENIDIQAALDGNLAFLATAGAAGAGEEWLYVKNDDPLDCVLERILVSADAATHIEFATCTGTAAGTDLNPVPGKLSVPLARSVEAKGNAAVTGLTPGDVFWEVELAVGVPQIFDLDLILGQNDDFCVTVVDAASVAISVVLRWRP